MRPPAPDTAGQRPSARGVVSSPRGTQKKLGANVGGPSNSDQEVVRQDSILVVLSQSHAHVQWRTIAEEFSSLLDPDFVDIVLKVRGKNGAAYMGAHRTLMAAAWRPLREDLRSLEHLPKEFLPKSLVWLDTPTAGELTSSGSNVMSPKAALGAASTPPEAGAPTLTSTSPASASPSPGPKEALVCHQEDIVGGASDLPASTAGVLDLTSKSWGSFTVVRALLCHLYSRPVAIPERELSILRNAAQSLGSTELARCCDDLDRRPLTRMAAGGMAAEDGRRTSPDIASPSFTSTSSTRAGTTTSSTHSAPAASDVNSSLKETHVSNSCLRPAENQEREMQDVGSAGVVRVASRPPKDDKATPNVFAKPWGERSLDPGDKGQRRESVRDTASAKPSAESGGVRRVLSEIKRNIVESSRIIADKTFQQMYEIVPGERGILGEGINGPVRMAKHRKTGQEVAVKKISCVNLSEQRRQMLVSEVRIFLQVSHRNVVQLLEVYESEADQAVLLVMELCTGKELFERLAERRWYSEFDAARVARQMLDAVSYLHSQNICHRDLKLENWIYESTSQEAKLKLCDFGFGQIVEPSVQLTATLGSLFYLAPEVLAGSYGLPCDMWSIGVIVYMLLSGVPPFDGKTDEAVMQKIRQGRFVSTGKRWEAISETAKHFVRSLLRKDPYERLTAAEAAQHAWLKMDSQPKAYSWPKGSPDSELELPIDRGVIRDMWKFAQNNAITRAALGMLAKLNTTSFGGREEDVLTLESRFRSYDETNCGKIDAEAFIKVLKETMQINQADEKQFFDRIAGNLPGHDHPESDDQTAGQKPRRRREVNYVDFITFTKARRMANNTAAIREAFRAFDESGDGFIREDDMHSILGDEFKSTIDDYVDINGKDLIDYVDFANIISKEMAKKEDHKEGTERQESAGAAVVPKAPTVAGPSVAPESSDAPSRTMSFVENSEPCASPPSDAEPVAANEASVPVAPVASEGVEQAGDQALGAETAKRAASPRNSAAAGGDAEGDEEEECDADAQSDEEQLVNVKNDESQTEAGDDAPPPKAEKDEKAKPALPKGPADTRFQSFSLSLAGSSEYDDHLGGVCGVNRVVSMPSDVYYIRQQPGFHSKILRPFYAAKPVSNIVMGLIHGTSLYAKQSVKAKLATIIHTTWGWFFIMPNPKYHTEVDNRKGLLSKETGKFRFVAWWIHPRFVPQLRQWFEKLTNELADERQAERREQLRAQRDAQRDRNRSLETPMPPDEVSRESKDSVGERVGVGERVAAGAQAGAAGGIVAAGSGVDSATDPLDYKVDPAARPAADPRSEAVAGDKKMDGMAPIDMGSPGDFRFSDVPKPDNYLHTYRDLHTKEHVSMLSQVYEGTHRFLRSLFDEQFLMNSTVSAGFHYPVRTQYATLHMQVRVNSGSVCRDDGRGIDIANLIDNMKRDRQQYVRDEDILKYHVTENVKVSLLAAASEYEELNSGESAARQTSPLNYELGLGAMPTIHDTEEGDDEDETGENGEERKPRKEAWSPKIRPQAGDTVPDLDLEDVHQDVSLSEGIVAQLEDGGRVPVGIQDDGDSIASYLVNLQPVVGTEFHRLLYKKRAECAELFGDDSTYLYPPHVSVTGFFETEPRSVRRLLKLLKECLAKESVSSITVGSVICTKSGYVLFDVEAPGMSSMATRLGEKSMRDLSVHIRPKAVNHISLASNRSELEVRNKIKALYEPAPGTECDAMREARESATFDIVLSRLLRRSSYEAMALDGPHVFHEVARIPLQEDYEDQEARCISPALGPVAGVGSSA